MIKTTDELMLDGHIGTSAYYKHWFTKSYYTDGFKDYMEQAACFWLFDIIATEVYDVVKLLDPDVRNFSVTQPDDQKTVLTLHGYDGNELWSKHMNYSTHPNGTFNFYIGWDGEALIACLHSEN